MILFSNLLLSNIIYSNHGWVVMHCGCDILDEEIINFLYHCHHRDDLLAGWVILVSQSPVIQGLYEPHSFLRDPELLQNLVDALQLTHSVAIRLEPLFIQGL